MAIELGIFVTPDVDANPTGQIAAADESGLDVVAIQDQSYQPRFYDTWTLLSHADADELSAAGSA